MKTQKEFKDNLLLKSISIIEFLQNLVDLDQSTSDHDNCYANIEVMEDPEIKKIFESSEEDTKYNYYHYLRLFYFHAFQDEAHKNGTTDNAKNYLENANKLSNTLEEILPNEDPLFAKYILGTYYYINSDLENLNIVIDDYEKGDKNDLTYSNINVLKRLRDGLFSNKSVDYKRDY